MRILKVGDRVRATNDNNIIATKKDEWEGIVTEVNGRSFSAKTIKCKHQSSVGEYFYALDPRDFELVNEQDAIDDKPTPFEYLLDYYGLKANEVFYLNGEKVYFKPNGMLIPENREEMLYEYSLLTDNAQIEKTPWKLTKGEEIWYIRPNNGKVRISFFMPDDPFHLSCLKNGWVFRTKGEAERNRKQVLAEMKDVLGS